MASANAGRQRVSGVRGSTVTARSMSGRATDTFPEIK
jgi:hypothetical protein